MCLLFLLTAKKTKYIVAKPIHQLCVIKLVTKFSKWEFSNGVMNIEIVACFRKYANGYDIATELCSAVG